jgi:hypothetical protein
MFLLDWYRQWLDIRSESQSRQIELTREVTTEEKICQSCETLKTQLEIVNYEKKQLLERLLEKPESEPERTKASELVAPRPRQVPWHVRRQMLETEDREKARAMKDAAKPDSTKVNVDELEKELKIAEETREHSS